MAEAGVVQARHGSTRSSSPSVSSVRSVGSVSSLSSVPSDEASRRATAAKAKALAADHALKRVADAVSQMLITHPEVLRVAPAHVAFQGFGKAFRPAKQTLYHKSQTSHEIERFWSHSWHGNWWAKVLTLFTLYNGLPAVLLGTLAAVVMVVPFSMGVLPGFARTGGETSYLHFSVWSFSAGFLVSTTVFALWRPRQKVFFDRICINENDPKLKAQAILSLAGMLKQSKEMLVLWDPSWSGRLWCLFELAAFLKCKKAKGGQLLTVRPAFVGPSSIAVFLAVSAGMLGALLFPVSGSDWQAMILPMLGFLACAAAAGVAAFVCLQRYFYLIHIFEERLRSCRFDEVTSACCEKNHLNDDCRPIMCDREVVMQCVARWFGSIEAFEEYIKAEVVEVVARELREDVFTSRWAMQVTAPVFWGFLDFAATYRRFGFVGWSFFFVASGMVVWLLCAPLLSKLATFLIRRFCSRSSTCCSRSSVASFLMILLVIALLLAAFVLPMILIPYVPDVSPYQWPFVFFGAVLLISFMLFVTKRLLQSESAPGKAEGWQCRDGVDPDRTAPGKAEGWQYPDGIDPDRTKTVVAL